MGFYKQEFIYTTRKKSPTVFLKVRSHAGQGITLKAITLVLELGSMEFGLFKRNKCVDTGSIQEKYIDVSEIYSNP